MSWFGKLAFGSIGMLIGGPLGAIAGATLGHHLIDKNNERQRLGTGSQQWRSVRPEEQAQASYFISLFSILGKFAKIDGVVSKDEINVVQKFIETLNLSPDQKIFAISIFNEAKDSRYSIEDFALQFYHINRHEPPLLNSFLDLLFQLAAADGTLHPSEEAALEKIKIIFHISDQAFSNLKGSYFNDFDLYYNRLNCTPDSTVDDIKRSYRKLVKDFHPDTIISKGLPEEFVTFATRRFQEIQEAYEKIRGERGF